MIIRKTLTCDEFLNYCEDQECKLEGQVFKYDKIYSYGWCNKIGVDMFKRTFYNDAKEEIEIVYAKIDNNTYYVYE